MTSTEIRQGFLDFFREKGHTLVPSSPLLPDAPNLHFTNAGMNQFVPIFLGQTPCPYKPARAADTQKCIRAGGKHNDLEDVGFDTYHHTLFEMLGNWSFGDYFKAEAIAWAWELVVNRWKFPKTRVFATVYKPGPGDPAAFDEEAYDLWADLFRKAGLDPEIHIVYGNVKDNFWKMGDTGPCGPCSELHIDLTPGEPELSVERQRAGALLVNSGSAQSIEIWNLVFIQFNSVGDGTYTNLPARHVDTGMGFERVTSMIQGTKNFTDFHNARISNYETDVFRPLFTALEEITGLKYGSTLPASGQVDLSKQEKIDVAFRVIGDHIRTLSFSIADGILPSNVFRGYVLRRILRRAVRYGSQIGCPQPFLAKLVPVLVKQMGEFFPELKTQQALIESTLTQEENSFLVNLERGEKVFLKTFTELQSKPEAVAKKVFPSDITFELFDTYGFPTDLTALMAKEKGWSVDEKAVELLQEKQKEESRKVQVKEVIKVSSISGDLKDLRPTHFTGFEELQTASIVASYDNGTLITTETPFYAELGGQLGDTGVAEVNGQKLIVTNTVKATGVAGVVAHRLAEPTAPVEIKPGDRVTLHVDEPRRARIEAHHSATHILHWALRKVLGNTVVQRGSYVGPDKFSFDFSHGSPLTDAQLDEVHQLIHEKVDEDAPITWEERLYAEVKGDPSILQLFGDKYGEKVRVVSIGDYSRELCGGTHLRKTGQTGYLRILSETGTQAGVRRIEVAAGPALIDEVRSKWKKENDLHHQLQTKAKAELSLTLADLPPLLENGAPIDYWKAWETAEAAHKAAVAQVVQSGKEQAKRQEAQWQSQASALVTEWLDSPVVTTISSTPFIGQIVTGQTGGFLPVLADTLKARWNGVAVLALAEGEKVTLVALSTPAFAKKFPAGKIIQTIAPHVGGKGGGRPDFAQGGGNKPAGIAAALAAAENFLRAA